MLPTDVNFIPNNFTQRRGVNENIGNIYIGEESGIISSSTTVQDYLKNTVFSGGYYGSIFKSIAGDTIGNVTVYRVSTTLAPYVKSPLTYVRSGDHVYGFSFQTGGGEGMITPPVYQWANYSDYEKIISTFKSL